MTKYIFTSERFTGSVVFGYDDEFNVLTYYKVEAEMNDKQLSYLLSNLPFHKVNIAGFAKAVKGVLQEEPADISFDAFWDAYDKKVNRKRAEPIYKKLADQERLMAIVAIKAYKKYCGQSGRAIADPEKFLRDRYFDTDWRGLK